MNWNYNMQMYPSYMPYSTYAPMQYGAWNQTPHNPAVRGNLVHVNPAFLQQPHAPVVHQGSSNKVLVNPKFFPQVHNANLPATVNPPLSPAPTVKLPKTRVAGEFAPTGSKYHFQKPTQAIPNRVVLLSSDHPKQMPKQPQLKFKTKLKLVNVPTSSTASASPSRPAPVNKVQRVTKLSPKAKVFQMNLKNKYKWKKGESPLKPLLLKNAYKLIRKSPSKSPRLSLSIKIPPFNGLVVLTPPKLASTPIEKGGVVSRFKLDNRSKEKKKTFKYPLGALKALRSKYKFVKNKHSKPDGSIVIRASHASVSRSFSNFNSFNKSLLLNRSKLHRTLTPKNIKSPKKSKAPGKVKKSNRYYDTVLNGKPEDDVLEDVDIVANSSGPVPRAPLGTLPSFITL